MQLDRGSDAGCNEPENSGSGLLFLFFGSLLLLFDHLFLSVLRLRLGLFLTFLLGNILLDWLKSLALGCLLKSTLERLSICWGKMSAITLLADNWDAKDILSALAKRMARVSA